jgi:hypothetical protein
MRTLIVAAIVLLALLTACRGEPVPRDYQNAPPDMKHPAQSESATPSAGATGQAPPQPTTGVEGPNTKSAPVTPPAQPTTTTMPDTPPVTTTT